MLLPKRVKHRRVQRGRLKGKATRGNKVTNGQFGIQALEPAWITSNQIDFVFSNFRIRSSHCEDFHLADSGMCKFCTYSSIIFCIGSDW